MSRDTPSQWGTPGPDGPGRRRSPVRTLIGSELPESRIFVDRLYRELTASGRRIQTGRLMRNRDNRPWFLLSRGEEDLTEP